MEGFPQIHPRTQLVNRARAAIEDTVSRVAAEYDLTAAEIHWAIAEVNHGWASLLLRAEREQPEAPTGKKD